MTTYERVRPERRPKRTFRGDIEGLRAVAVILVICDHLFRQPRGGFIGVDVFFVISGYLITGLLLRERERSGRISYREFYARRARRILPIALLVLLITALGARYVFAAGRARDTVVDALWASGFLANVRFASLGTDYFQNERPPSAVQHYWSLAVEEQFYVIWPTVLLVLFAIAARSRIGRKGLLAAAAVIATIASFLWCVRLTQTSPTDAYFSTPARAWELGVGAVVVIAQDRLATFAEGVRAAASWLGLAGVAASALLISDATSFPGTAAALPVFATALILGSNSARGGVGSQFALGSLPVRYVGRISYSLYLWHWPFIVLATGYYGHGTRAFYLVAGLLPIVMSVVSFHSIEDPLRTSTLFSRRTGNGRSSLSRTLKRHETALANGAVGLAVLLLIPALLPVLFEPRPAIVEDAPPATALGEPLAGPTPDTRDPLARKIDAALQQTSWSGLTPSLDDLPATVVPEWHPDNCVYVVPQSLSHCRYGKGGAHTAVVIGDSFAASYMPGIRAALERKGWAVQMLTYGECPVPDVVTWKDERTRAPNRECSQHREWAVGVIKDMKPDLVIGASRSLYASRLLGSGDPATEWRTGLVKTLTAIKPYAKRTVILGDPPGSKNLQDCATRTSTPQSCVGTVSPLYASLRDAQRAAAASTGAIFVDVEPWFCYQGRCPAVIESTPVFWDGGHLTRQYSAKLAPLIAAQLRL